VLVTQRVDDHFFTPLYLTLAHPLHARTVIKFPVNQIQIFLWFKIESVIIFFITAVQNSQENQNSNLKISDLFFADEPQKQVPFSNDCTETGTRCENQLWGHDG
jgi:hypothetical protein